MTVFVTSGVYFCIFIINTIELWVEKGLNEMRRLSRAMWFECMNAAFSDNTGYLVFDELKQ